MSSFLDGLLQAEIRRAYLSGRPCFVVSSRLDEILWTNGAGARFLGYQHVGQAIGRGSSFDRADKRQINTGLESGRQVQLRGKTGRCRFIISSFDGVDQQQAILFEGLDDQLADDGEDALIAGLSDAQSFAAIYDRQGNVLAVDDRYRDLSQQIRESAVSLFDIARIDGVERKKIITNGKAYWCGALQLSQEPQTYLMVAVNDMTVEDGASDWSQTDQKLDDQDRLALREIAERLRMDMASSEWADKGGGAEPHMPSSQQQSVLQLQDLYALIDMVGDGLIILDQHSYISYMSGAAAALLGLENRSFDDRSFLDLFAPLARSVLDAYFGGLQSSPFNQGCEIAAHQGHNPHPAFYLYAMALPSQNGFGVIIRDLSERNAETARLLEKVTQDPLPLSFAQIIHEIRTPLNAILGFAEIMRDEKFGTIGNERYREYLRDIVRSGRHVLSLVNDMLEQSKEQHENTRPVDIDKKATLSRLDLWPVLYEVASLMQEEANRNGVILRINRARNLPHLAIKGRSLRQILLNLVSNAIRFTPAGGQVVLAASHAAGVVTLMVSDTGIGMNPQGIEKALQPYGQVPRQNPRQGDAVFQGTGLGLPLTKAMVEAEGGHFRLTSVPGQGTKVELEFPV